MHTRRYPTEGRNDKRAPHGPSLSGRPESCRDDTSARAQDREERREGAEHRPDRERDEAASTSWSDPPTSACAPCSATLSGRMLSGPAAAGASAGSTSVPAATTWMPSAVSETMSPARGRNAHSAWCTNAKLTAVTSERPAAARNRGGTPSRTNPTQTSAPARARTAHATSAPSRASASADTGVESALRAKGRTTRNVAIAPSQSAMGAIIASADCWPEVGPAAWSEATVMGCATTEAMFCCCACV